MSLSTTAARQDAGKAFRRQVRKTVRSVGGGIALTLLVIGLVELINATLFRVPKPSPLYLLAVAAASMLGGRRAGLISALIAFGYSVYATHIPGQIPLAFADQQTTRLTLFGIAAPTMALLVGGLRKRNDDLLRERLRRELASEQATRDLERERRIAATLQSVLLAPLPTEAEIPGVAFGSCYEAAYDEAEVGGDFYDVFPLGSEAVAVVVGDVSGKGLVAAARTAEVKYTLRAALHDACDRRGRSSAEPLGETLARVNRMLAPGLSQNLPPNLPPATPESTPDVVVALPAFVCLSVAVLNTKTGVGETAVAGMEPPLLLRQSPPLSNGSAPTIHGEILEIGGLPIGVLDEAEFQTTAFRLGVGDILLLTSDGVLESRRKGSRDLFGLDGLRRSSEASLSEATGNGGSREKQLRDVARGVVESAKAFAYATTLKDDACVLLVQRTETYEPSPVAAGAVGAATTVAAP